MEQENKDQQVVENGTVEQKAPETETVSKEAVSGQDKFWAFLSYLGVLFLIPLLLKRDSKFIQHHAKQGLVMFIAEFFFWIPLFGWILALIIFIFWIMAIIQVVSGEMKPLPIVGDLAKKLDI